VKDWALTDILITHHHHDHVGGVAELKQKYSCRVVAPHDNTTNDRLMSICAQLTATSSRLGTCWHGCWKRRAIRSITSPTSSTARKPCSPPTRCSRSAAAGCSRDLSDDVGFASEAAALPDDFKLYCGHEYTASNVKFALTVEPDNEALKARPKR